MVLADLGADVIKIEPPGGEISRTRIGTYRGYDFGNRNKRSLVLDLKQDAGRNVVRSLAKRADIFIENYRVGALAAWGLAYEDLAAVNPKLVYCSVTGFGSNGPYRDRSGLDLVAQAMSGIMSVTGTPGGEKVTCGVPVADIGAGLFGTIGALAALLEARRTGRGQHVETSLIESAVAFATWEFGPYLRTGAVPTAFGSRRKNVVPYGAYATSDGAIVVAVNTPALWERLLQVLGDAELVADTRFKTLPLRLTHREALEQRLVSIFSTRSNEAWITALGRAGIPCGPVNTIPEAAADAHLQCRGMFPSIEGDRYIATPIHLSRTPQAPLRPPRELGADSRAILTEAGFDDQEIASLISDGAVADLSG